MAKPIKILLQTTISATEDDWHIGRFGLLRDLLASAKNADGSLRYHVVARDRSVTGAADPVLSTIDQSDFNELWLFAVDVGDGLTAEDCAAISRFRRDGGGLLVSRDHMDLGSSVCSLGGVGDAHHFHSKNPERDATRHQPDDPYTQTISWPNYHSGANGDYQDVRIVDAPHPVFANVPHLPAHPHEGAVGAPPDDPSARVIASGTSRVTGNAFNLAVAFEPSLAGGPAIADSSFHHFADYNWDPAKGAPTFVTEPPGRAIVDNAAARASAERYALNLAGWLATGRA